MRTYGQYCAIARTLDVVGDRWTLLIVRELLLQGPCRYTDLRNGLPRIATNLLADRLRELEQAGLVESRAAPPPVATTLFSLTDRGRALQPVLRELVTWGAELMPSGPSEEDSFRSHWLGFPASLYLRAAPDQAPVALELRTGEESVTILAADGSVRVQPGATPEPDLVLSGAPQLLLGAISGLLPLEDARALGLVIDGDPGVLVRLQ
ncbi:helix-turn-helix domain-containing protein [Nocardioides sp.]|uniref:winged helix-turn-helix transcriptional regulator n=1 Tax=Nocardioides sp. TaxID=35761 RepID=UPI00273261AC|nr:winged helix-turn-helix transcriptional regulator [Nocardioides sp.]MDP3892052.1 winged helix-turn-helix transcriptional regulator [Nocardioides sp.]